METIAEHKTANTDCWITVLDHVFAVTNTYTGASAGSVSCGDDNSNSWTFAGTDGIFYFGFGVLSFGIGGALI